MKKKIFVSGTFLVLILAVAVSADQYKVVGEKGDFYFGHVSYVDAKDEAAAPAVFRWGNQTPEAAVLNLPLGPGDVIQTSDSGRCEIQFDNGTVLRLDVNTKLKIETILAQTLSTAQKVSNLLVAQDHVYVMYKKYSPLELFQVITPSTSVKLSDNAVALVEVSDNRAAVQMERGRAEVLYGKDGDHVSQKKVNAGERLVIGADNIAQPAEYAAASEFKSWNQKINANFQALHEGNVLPKPLQKLPPAVFEFAQKFGNLNGEWIWHDLYGYVWRPYLNDLRYPWGGWQPYFYGNWTSYNGQLYWVPGEPWGWVPYHLGLWMWDAKSGWVWMPGSLFAPAWVDWDFLFGYYFWRPFTLFDYYDEWLSSYYLAGGFYGPEWYGGGSGGVSPGASSPGNPVRTIINKDQLKPKPGSSLPVPKEMKTALRAVGDALQRGDERAFSSLRGTLSRSVIISKSDFGKPGWQGKAVSLDRLLESPEVKSRGAQSALRDPSQSVARDALRSYEALRTMREVKARTDAALLNPNRTAAPGDFRFGLERPSLRPDAAVQDRVGTGGRQGPPASGPGRISRGDGSGMRFRDWNPDIRAAAKLGVDIGYSSRTNEVFSPQLGLRSRDVMSRSRFSPAFQGFSPGLGMGGGAGLSSGGTASSGPAQGSLSPPSTSSSSGPRGSTKESGGGKQN